MWGVDPAYGVFTQLVTPIGYFFSDEQMAKTYG